MEKEEGRRLCSAAQHEHRRQVIRAWKREIIKAKIKIAKDVGLSYSGIDKIIRGYESQRQLAPRPKV